MKAIQSAAEGKPYLAPTVASRLATDYLQRAPGNQERHRLDGLTPREREILTLIAEGHTNQQIADRLVVSVKTVETHRTNLMQKLDLHDRTELVKYAIRKGLISLEPAGQPIPRDTSAEGETHTTGSIVVPTDGRRRRSRRSWWPCRWRRRCTAR